MDIIRTAFKYLRQWPLISVFTLVSILLAAVFEGASFGMLVPLLQGMTDSSQNLLAKIPLPADLGFSFTSIDNVKLISFIFILMFLLILVKNVFVYLSSILIAKLRFGIMRDMRIRLVGNLLEYDMKFFDNAKMGHIIGNVNVETQRMGDFVRSVMTFATYCVKVAAYIFILLLISFKVSIVVFILIAFILIPVELILSKMKKFGTTISESIAEYNYKLTEILNGIRLIKSYGTEPMEKKNFNSVANDIYRAYYLSMKYMQAIIPLSEVLVFGLIVICFLALVKFTKIDVIAIFPFIATYLVVLTRMLTQLSALNSSRSAAMRDMPAITSYERMYDEKGKKTIKSGTAKIDRFSDSIVFKDVNFSYVRGKEILKNVNLRIPEGKMTALVGVSGAGKSTIINLIPRFYDIVSGKILIDGIDLRTVSLPEWRRKIGFVSQDVFIFNSTVKENILYSHENIREEGFLKAVKAANAHDFIMELPQKYDTLLGEKGAKLSGGQKQRISIARAIIHDPEILILDEATSSLDTETEKLITDAVSRLTENRTVIAIAHRLSTVLHADNIIVMQNGRIVEEGTHSELIKKSGVYTRLYELQFGVNKQLTAGEQSRLMTNL